MATGKLKARFGFRGPVKFIGGGTVIMRCLDVGPCTCNIVDRFWALSALCGLARPAKVRSRKRPFGANSAYASKADIRSVGFAPGDPLLASRQAQQ